MLEELRIVSWWKKYAKKIGHAKSIVVLLVVEVFILMTLICCTYYRVVSTSKENMTKISNLKDSTEIKSARLAEKIRTLKVSNVKVDVTMSQNNYKKGIEPISSLSIGEKPQLDEGKSEPSVLLGNVCMCDSMIGQILIEVSADFNHRLDNVLADIRQESNNQLNWLNTWVAIWLSALSAMGIVLPLLITYSVNQKAREENEKIVNSMKIEVADVKNQIIKMNAMNQVATVINCATTLKELGRQHFTPERKRYWQQLLLLLIEKNKVYVNSIEKNDQICTEKDLLVYLLQIQVLMNTLEPYYIYPRTHAILAEIKKNLRKLLKSYLSSTNKEIVEWLGQLQRPLKELSDATEEETKNM